MALKDIVKVNRKTFFDPRGWLGYDLLKEQTVNIWSFLRAAFAPSRVEHEETFEQAMVRMKVNEADVKRLEKTYYLYALFFAGLAIPMFLYGFFLVFFYHSLLGWMLSMAVTALLLAQAFRYHFWYFQIKNRKLGCTFQEWRQGKINEPSSPP